LSHSAGLILLPAIAAAGLGLLFGLGPEEAIPLGILVLVIAFSAMFSTTYTVMDGMPRTLTAAWRHIQGDGDADRADRGRLYWGYLIAMTFGSLGVVAMVPDPIRLITVLAAVTFIFSPLWFVLNTWCVKRFVTDQQMRPSRVDFTLAGFGIVFMVGTALLLIYTDVLKPLQGG